MALRHDHIHTKHDDQPVVSLMKLASLSEYTRSNTTITTGNIVMSTTITSAIILPPFQAHNGCHGLMGAYRPVSYKQPLGKHHH